MNELILLLNSSSSKVQCQAALALRNLASDEFFQLMIAQHPHGLPKLLQMLSEDAFFLTQQPSFSNVNTASTDKATAIPTAEHSAQLTVAAVACIRNISIHPSNESRLIDAQFLAPLVKLLIHPSEEVQGHAISTLRNLAAGNEEEGKDRERISGNKLKIVESGAVEMIQTVLAEEGVGWPILSEMTACLAVLSLSG